MKNNKKIAIYILATFFCVGLICICIFYNNSQSINLEELESQNNLQELVITNNQNQNETTAENTTETTENNIFVHITGEVNNQGIVILQQGDRIIDAIEKAGGTTELADVSKVNLAFVLTDGQKVKIPNKNENTDNFVYVTNASGDNVINENMDSVSKDNTKVNINTATQTQLETLSGIGPSIAAKIVQYREKNGKFKKIEDLKNVSGIGNSKFESIKDSIVVQ